MTGAEPAKFTLPSYTTHKLENGVTLLLMERHQLPLVSFVWLMRSGGSICEPEGREGLASLTAQLLRKGTKNRTADQISEELDFVGASLDAGASHDYASGSAEFVSKDLELAVALLADILQNSVFPKDEVSKLIKQEVDGIAEAKEVPNQVLSRYFRGLLFGTHPYARPVSGTEISLPTMLPVKFATSLLKDRNGVIALDLLVSGTLDDPKFRIGPVIWQIGTDGGYLDAPVKIDPAAAFNNKLTIMPGERYDVIVDFNDPAWRAANPAFSGQLLLRNTGRTPYPKGAAPQGSTLGQVLKLFIGPPVADTGYNPASGIPIRPAGGEIARLVNPATGTAAVPAQKTRLLTLWPSRTCPPRASSSTKR